MKQEVLHCRRDHQQHVLLSPVSLFLESSVFVQRQLKYVILNDPFIVDYIYSWAVLIRAGGIASDSMPTLG
jgi:hypothetical protein